MTKDPSVLLENARAARRDNRPSDARRDYTLAIELTRQTGDQRELVTALKGLAQIERDSGAPAVAIALYEEAAAICRGLDDRSALAHTIRHIGDIHQDNGRLDLARPCYEEALSLYRTLNDCPTLDLANALRPMALLLEKCGEIDAAQNHWQEAKDLYAVVGVSAGVTECSKHLGNLMM